LIHGAVDAAAERLVVEVGASFHPRCVSTVAPGPAVRPAEDPRPPDHLYPCQLRHVRGQLRGVAVGGDEPAAAVGRLTNNMDCK
jgi:hypothetical protein